MGEGVGDGEVGGPGDGEGLGLGPGGWGDIIVFCGQRVSDIARKVGATGSREWGRTGSSRRGSHFVNKDVLTP